MLHLQNKTKTTTTTTTTTILWPLNFVQDYQGEQYQKGKTSKVKQIWIYWNKR